MKPMDRFERNWNARKVSLGYQVWQEIGTAVQIANRVGIGPALPSLLTYLPRTKDRGACQALAWQSLFRQRFAATNRIQGRAATSRFALWRLAGAKATVSVFRPTAGVKGFAGSQAVWLGCGER